MSTPTPKPGPHLHSASRTAVGVVLRRQLVLAATWFHDQAVVVQGTQSVDGEVIITEHASKAGFRATTSLQHDLFTAAYRELPGTSLDVYFASRRFLTLVNPFAAAFPLATIHAACPPAMTPLYRAVDRARTTAFDRIRSEVEAAKNIRVSVESTEVRPVPLVLGTDASVGRGRRGAGIACVDEDGRYAVRYLPRTASILVAELQAIELALDTFPGRDLHIRCDSLNAVNAVHRASADLPSSCNHRAVRAVVTRILAGATGRQLLLSWTRGHCGDPLNEAADRFARLARRSQLSLPESSLQLIASGITAELATQLSG